MDKGKLKAWLITESKDRDWLASQLGCSKGTVDQWFSRGFPEWATKAIERLINPQTPETSGLEITFTAAEFERIEQARELLKLASRKQFYETAINEFTEQVLEAEKTLDPPNITHFSASSTVKPDERKVAEIPRPYRTDRATGTED